MIHHLWWSTLFGLGVAVVCRAWRNGPAAMRHALYLAALVKFALPPLSLPVGTPESWRTVRAAIPSPDWTRLRAWEAARPPAAVYRRWLLALPAAWIAGAAVVLAISVGRYRRFQASLREARFLESGREWDLLQRAAKRAGVRRGVQLCVVAGNLGPLVVGYWRPRVLLAEGSARELSDAELEAVLLHELWHVRRWDNLTGAFLVLVQAAYWFHPLVWWLHRRIAAEREWACDDGALALGEEPASYAAAVGKLCRWSLGNGLGAISAATGSELKERMERIMNGAGQQDMRKWHRAAVALALTVAGAAQVTEAPHREVINGVAGGVVSGVVGGVPGGVRGVIGGVPQERQRMLAFAQQAPPKAEPARSPYDKWLEEDVVYIITDRERAAFRKLPSDPERERFIEQFWQVRTPEAKNEHYRRIANANQRFGINGPGWKTPRGRIYILYGPPDEIESHPSSPEPFEKWRYHSGVLAGMTIEFSLRP